MTDWQELDFFKDPGLVADPYPYLAAARERCPVWREPHHGVVMVTGYDEAAEVFHDAATFSSCISVTGPFPGFPVPIEGDDVSELIERYRDTLPFSDQLPALDPPVHTNHRALLMRLITPKRLKENEASMWRLADSLLDRFLAGDASAADGRPATGEFISGFATPFTLLIIADLLGLPEEDQQDLVATMRDGQRSGGGVGDTSQRAMAHNPLGGLYQRFARYIEDRRREPGDDVLSGLAGATFPDGSLPEVADVVRIAANLFSAGQETTVRLLGSALKVLAEDPGMQRRLREDRNRIPGFIEETLRAESPVKGDFRLSRVPVTVGGVDLPAGTYVMVLNGAANRDPRHFDDPDRFDETRPNARHHIAFGRGIHTCPGAPLARAEARVAIERLLDRTSDIAISEREHGPAGARRYRYIRTFILRGLTQLHLEFR
jgi:cytochrome P450 family 150 subfamily A5